MKVESFQAVIKREKECKQKKSETNSDGINDEQNRSSAVRGILWAKFRICVVLTFP